MDEMKGDWPYEDVGDIYYNGNTPCVKCSSPFVFDKNGFVWDMATGGERLLIVTRRCLKCNVQWQEICQGQDNLINKIKEARMRRRY